MRESEGVRVCVLEIVRVKVMGLESASTCHLTPLAHKKKPDESKTSQTQSENCLKTHKHNKV